MNYIYGTWQVVGGLHSVGYDMTEPWVKQSGKWLKAVQKPDGSFGESCDSYEDPTLKGQGHATASQTAWGAMSLMAVFGPDDPDVGRAIQWLCDTQISVATSEPDVLQGTWDEPWFTGTGFPKVFYLRYHFYRLYFPIMAIGRWLRSGQTRSLLPIHRAAQFTQLLPERIAGKAFRVQQKIELTEVVRCTLCGLQRRCIRAA